MKKAATILLTLLICVSAICQDPVITMTTTKSIGSEFSFELIANAEDTPIQVDFGDGNLVNKTVGTSNISIIDTLVGSQTIKIYGTGIIYLNCSSNQLSTLDVTNDTVLTELHCRYNKLTALDVTKNTVLTNLDCADNQLNILDVTKNTYLTHFICFDNQLTTLDVTKNTALMSIDCSNNQLTALDVTKNTALMSLSCSDNQLATQNVTKNTDLTYLDCFNNQLTTLDVTKNTALVSLWCSNNQLTTLDVTQNTALTQLFCSSNKLTALDVTQNTALTQLDCPINQLTLISLPIKQTSWSSYNYSPQQPIPIAKSSNIGDELDLSSQNSVNGNATAYTWKTKGGVTLVEGTDYTITNGKTVFLKDPTDIVYCEMTNEAFPDFTNDKVLSTTCLKLALASPTAVTDIEAPGVEMYSNQGNIYINTPYNAQVSIYELNGRLVFSGKLTTGSNSIQLQNTGIYLVKFLGNNDVSTKKVFVQ